MLDETQSHIRDMSRRFSQEQLAPFASEADRMGKWRMDPWPKIAKAGLSGILIPEQYGGAGADYVSFSQAIMEIAAADGACSTVVQVHNGLVCGGILRYGTEEQKQEFLIPLAKGIKLGCFCLTEPDAGSDAGALKTRARREGEHYILTGSKQFITSGGSADIAVVFAATDPSLGKKGISAFLINTDTSGYDVSRHEATMGQKASDHCQITFNECRVPVSNLLGEEGAGYRIALSNLEGGRIGVASQAVGMAKSAYEKALEYAQERKAFGKPIFDHQAVGFRLAEMATDLFAAELMIWRAATLRDQGKACLREASMAKLFSTEVAERVCTNAIQTLGGYGYLADYELERIYRDVRVCRIYEGTSDIQKLIIMKEL
ncbi:MAG: acyl-CoA dehydrogenase family protein [Sneathiella sp.]